MIGRWFVGFAVFVGYLCLGAFVFYRIERKEEEKRHYLEILERLELKELLAKHYGQVNAHVRRQFVQQLNAYCNKTVLDEGPDNEEAHQYQWTYYNAFFFALTTLSTIGYGNLHPTSGTGRILVLVYSLIGIPLNGIVLTQLGSFFESRILRAHYSYKTQRMMGPQLSLILDIVTYLIPGIIVFIFIPSGIISYFENWTFDESVYFTFVTLTTIGYGDYVAGQTVNTNIWYDAYKVFLVFWIMFGLGYLFMILSFISRAMRSKTLEHLFLERLKQTHTKIWHQFTKDVVYIRRVLNESYLLKFKPVYKKEVLSRDQPLRRSRSAPNLTEWPVLCKTPAKVPVTRRTSDDEDEETVRRRFEKHRMKRRRALSQNKMRSLLRRTKATSEIDLAHIDKDATFGADIASYEILSRVVDALETAVPNQPGDHQHQPSQHVHHHLHQEAGNLNKGKALSFSEGVQGFSSEDIIAGEKNEWTVGGDMLNRENTFAAKHRNSYFEYDTWGGADNQNFKKFNEYAKNSGGPNKPRVPKLRRMSAAAFNFLSNNIAPKWLTDKLADGGGGGGGGGEPTWNDDPRHRLSLNDEQGYGYGSTYNGAPSAVNRRSAPVPYQHRGSYGLQVVHDPQVYGSSAPEHPRHRRLSSPDPVLAHCANTIAVADFLMTLQRSLDGSSLTGGTSGAHHGLNRSAITGGGFGSVARHERRSPLFTLFQDRPRRASGESWQYSSLTSTLSSTSTAVSTATTLATDAGTINAVHDQPAAATTTRRSRKKRARRFSIRPTVGSAEHNGSARCWTTPSGANNTIYGTTDDSDLKGRGAIGGPGTGFIGASGGEVRLNIED
ncbi:hypothetical protein AGLY_010850 [Aphis glycines]|uniref:Potassium channel domain-containing protein n=1 Tax=Aphis glycines TaxID=307491 RepID=A0A6G0TFC7_APHGL|nr:hypothetical protein AGLY_010850 [Aphis glycines]